jgi:hypothetical protein
MSGAGTKLGVGPHFRLDGETVEVVEFASLATGVTAVAPALSVCFSRAKAADGSGDLPMHVRPARR